MTKGDPRWAETQDVWEHERPYDMVEDVFLTGDVAFCDDGTVWSGSSGHGIARRDPSGNVTQIDRRANPRIADLAHVWITDSKGHVSPGVVLGGRGAVRERAAWKR